MRRSVMILGDLKPYFEQCQKVIESERPATLANPNWKRQAAKGMLQVLDAMALKKGKRRVK